MTLPAALRPPSRPLVEVVIRLSAIEVRFLPSTHTRDLGLAVFLVPTLAPRTGAGLALRAEVVSAALVRVEGVKRLQLAAQLAAFQRPAPHGQSNDSGEELRSSYKRGTTAGTR